MILNDFELLRFITEETERHVVVCDCMSFYTLDYQTLSDTVTLDYQTLSGTVTLYETCSSMALHVIL